MNAITRAFEAVVDDVKPGERSVVAKINTDIVDRYRTVIDPRGIDLSAYRRNPVVLWEHGKDPNRGTVPIGKNKWIRAEEGKLLAKTIFRDDAYSDMIFRAYQDEGLRGWSVNVLPRESGPPTHDEKRSRPHWEGADLIYRSTELAEYSGTAVPGNPDTLTVMASRGIWIPDEARTMTESMGGMEGGGGAVKAEESDSVERYIKHEGGKWVIYSESGKVLGKFDSKEAAEKRLREIEYFKHQDKGRTFAQIQYEMLTLIRSWRDETRADLQAMQDLWISGRV